MAVQIKEWSKSSQCQVIKNRQTETDPLAAVRGIERRLNETSSIFPFSLCLVAQKVLQSGK